MPAPRSAPDQCPGTLGRRAFVRSGLAGLWSLGLSDLLRLRAAARPSEVSSPKSVIALWLWGGPSHLDTFDPKPDARCGAKRGRRRCRRAGPFSVSYAGLWGQAALGLRSFAQWPATSGSTRPYFGMRPCSFVECGMIGRR